MLIGCPFSTKRQQCGKKEPLPPLLDDNIYTESSPVTRKSDHQHLDLNSELYFNMVTTANSSPPGNCKFAIPKKGRLFEKVADLLKGSGIEYQRAPRLDVALCKDLPITLVFLPAADIAKYVGEGNVDIGITGYDVVRESNVEVEKVMDLGFGACKLCVQAPVADQITDVSTLAGGRIVTSFPHLTEEFFRPLDEKKGVKTKIIEVSGSVEAACGLGLADAVVDLVETGTTMRVSGSKAKSMMFLLNFSTF